MTYWAQATAIIGRNMGQAMTNFPNSTVNGACPNISCYGGGQMYILREDAFDWDVLGHEFFHFTTATGAARVIDTSLGGNHSGGSAIGQNDGTGHIRTRDEGMRLAWSEGLATFMSIKLQITPADLVFTFPTGLLNLGDAVYQDTEDSTVTTDFETPSSNQGFGSENSVTGVLWDLVDANQDTDGTAKDTASFPAMPLQIWNLINRDLASCNPCDRVDRLWSALLTQLGINHPSLLPAATAFVLDKMAPRADAPADGTSVAPGVAPTFQWTANGDPAAAHVNNQFQLLFSRDNFQSHVVTINVPALGANSYTPTAAEWASVLAGGSSGQEYKWLVAGQRADAPVIPNGGWWYSNQLRFTPRRFSGKITWTPLGADVDFHLTNPEAELYYAHRAVSFGFLDRDCITTCTEENISVTGLPLPGFYRLYTLYYSDHGLGPASVHAQVFDGPTVVVDLNFVLPTTGSTHDIASFTLPAHKIEIKPGGAAGWVDPSTFPPK